MVTDIYGNRGVSSIRPIGSIPHLPLASLFAQYVLFQIRSPGNWPQRHRSVGSGIESRFAEIRSAFCSAPDRCATRRGSFAWHPVLSLPARRATRAVVSDLELPDAAGSAAVFGLPGSFNRYVEMYRQSGQLKSFLYRITGISLVMTILFSIVMYCFAEQFSHWLYRDERQTSLVIVMAMSLLFVTIFNFAASLLEALRQVRLVTTMRFVNGLAFAAFGIAFLLMAENGTEAVTIAFAISCVVATIPAVWYFARNWSVIDSSNVPLPQKSMWSRVAPFAAWLWVINLVSNMYEVADRNMLLHLAPVSRPRHKRWSGNITVAESFH